MFEIIKQNGISSSIDEAIGSEFFRVTENEAAPEMKMSASSRARPTMLSSSPTSDY